MDLPPKKKWAERFYALCAIVIGMVLLVSFSGRYLMLHKTAPDHMIVYTVEETGIYYAPPYILGNKYPDTLDTGQLKAMTIAEAQEHGYRADTVCTQLGYFRESTTLNYNILLFLGLTEPNPSRWNEDGSWNW